ncbi:MAG: SOS response-associated peptidase [Spartobacteria bacterium]|nr:SOS response-associated peptidase [Spartobacteria bacterium]
MCGRFAACVTADELEAIFTALFFEEDLIADVNVAPSQRAGAVLSHQGRCVYRSMTFGVMPHVAAAPVINARMETLDEKPLFSHAFQTHRCLIPVSGFYEWKDRQPYYFYCEPCRPLLLGALYYVSSAPSFVVITRDAAPCISDIHHRMPLLVHPDRATTWLSTEDASPADTWVRQCIDMQPLCRHAVTRQINKTAYHHPDATQAIIVSEQMTLF